MRRFKTKESLSFQIALLILTRRLNAKKINLNFRSSGVYDRSS
jgi:hypothetical protein